MADSYKGVRDFYPEDERLRRYLFGVMEEVSESFGYEPYDASILEPTELYTAKTSEEIIKEQTYTFVDRGGRSVTLRPEMTPTVARMVAKKRRELGFPLRWYSIPNLFRYENPQKGRLREHWQLNVDLFGAVGIDADAEIINVAYQLLTSYGATENMFSIKVADRELLETALDACELSGEQKRAYRTVLDKRQKMKPAEFKKEVGKITDTDPVALIERRDPAVLEACTNIDALMKDLEVRGINNAIFDPGIVRGFDYYTGMVFEIFDVSGENTRSMFGGGRYDYLVEEYGGESVPAAGFGMGDVTLRDFLETHNLLPDVSATTDIYLAPVTAQSHLSAHGAAAFLREKGLNIALGLKHEKIADHIKAANKLHIPYFIAYGQNEHQSGMVELKHLPSKETQSLPLSEVPRTVFENQ